MDLASYCAELATACDDGRKWVERNSDLVRNEKEGLLKELRHAARVFRACGRAASHKMCAGVFGPSQAGKSYLISALARGEGKELLARFGDEAHDFISEINPEGGKESTGLVTRFTLTEDPDAPGDSPVRLSMLSEMDLVKILANAYYADCEHKEDAQSDIAASLDKLKGRAVVKATHITLDDLEDLREYLLKDFRSKTRVRELENSYWDTALSIGPHLDLEGRIQLYAIIWDEVGELTSLLRQLLEALKQLDYPDRLYCPLAALLPRKDSIIDVAALSGLGAPDAVADLSVRAPNGKQATLPRAVVAALTAELSITMKESPADYFEHTDLLDFPGYRSRYKLEDLPRELKKEGMLKELFLRGKVAYLFERYCAEKDLNSMLLCIGPSNQEVQDLPGVINDWVCSTHGDTPEERAGKQVSLFFILTKFDMEFEEKSGAPSLEARWDNRLHASLLDFFGKQHDWPEHWTPDRGFDNLFLLRNPNFKFGSVLTYAGDQETGIRPESAGLVEKLHSSFMNSPLVAAHFKNPALAWDEAMRLNDGGISHIRASLSPLCDPGIKERQLMMNIDASREAIRRRLQAFYQTDDRAELRKEKIRLLATLFQRLGLMEKQTHRMGALLRDLAISDSFIQDIQPEASRRYREIVELGKTESDGAPSIIDTENLDMDSIDLGSFNILANSGQSSAIGQASPVAVQDEAAFLAEFIESRWVENLHKLADDPVMRKYYSLPAREFSALASELATGAARLGFKNAIAAAFREASAYADAQKGGIASKRAAIAARIINDYVDWLGFNPSLQQNERTVTLPGAQPAVVFSPHPAVKGLPMLAERNGDSEMPWASRWFGDWLNAFGALVLDNVNFNGKETFNAAENTALGAIIRKLSQEAPIVPA